MKTKFLVRLVICLAILLALPVEAQFKDPQGRNFPYATTIGTNDVIIINVNGSTNKNVRYQTLKDQLEQDLDIPDAGSTEGVASGQGITIRTNGNVFIPDVTGTLTNIAQSVVFTNIAEMVASRLTNGLVFVQSYWGSNTIGNGHFRHSTNAATTNLGTIFASAFGGYWKRQTESANLFRADWFGLWPANSGVVADDMRLQTTRIQNAIDTAPERGGVVVMPAYPVTSETLTISNKFGFQLRGDIDSGSAKTIYWPNPAPIICYNGTPGGNMINLYNSGSVKLSNIGLESRPPIHLNISFAWASNYANVCVDADQFFPWQYITTEISFENVQFRDRGTNANWVGTRQAYASWQNCEQFTWEGCTFQGAGNSGYWWHTTNAMGLAGIRVGGNGGGGNVFANSIERCNFFGLGYYVLATNGSFNVIGGLGTGAGVCSFLLNAGPNTITGFRDEGMRRFLSSQYGQNELVACEIATAFGYPGNPSSEIEQIDGTILILRNNNFNDDDASYAPGLIRAITNSFTDTGRLTMTGNHLPNENPSLIPWNRFQSSYSSKGDFSTINPLSWWERFPLSTYSATINTNKFVMDYSDASTPTLKLMPGFGRVMVGSTILNADFGVNSTSPAVSVAFSDTAKNPRFQFFGNGALGEMIARGDTRTYLELIATNSAQINLSAGFSGNFLDYYGAAFSLRPAGSTPQITLGLSDTILLQSANPIAGLTINSEQTISTGRLDIAKSLIVRSNTAANWPSAPPSFGAFDVVNSNGVPYIRESGLGNTFSSLKRIGLSTFSQILEVVTGTPNGAKFLRDDGAWAAIPGGGDALVSSPLSQFAATTSLQLSGVLSDETGSGAAVFAIDPIFSAGLTIATPATPTAGTPSTYLAWLPDGRVQRFLNGILWTNLNADELRSGTIPAARMPALTGDVTTSAGAVATTIASGSVSLAKMANLAQDQFIGRTTASTGVPETATITAAARTVLDDTSVAAMVDTLGGASATGSGGLVRANSPALVTPALGTIASGVGAALTALNASALGSGTVPDARMPAHTGDVTSSAGSVALTIAANAVALTTDTTGNYVSDVAGTANEITSTHTPGEGSTATISLPAAIDLGGKTSFELPNAAAPTTSVFGQVAGDNNAWASGRGALQAYDGTANTWLIGVLASDTPSNGQVPTYNTDGTITWETPSGGGATIEYSNGQDVFTVSGNDSVTLNTSAGASFAAFNTTAGSLTIDISSAQFSMNSSGFEIQVPGGAEALEVVTSGIRPTSAAITPGTLLGVGASGYMESVTSLASLDVDNLIVNTSVSFEGATADANETSILVTDPTADNSITLPNASGTLILSGHTFSGDVTGTLGTGGTTALTIGANTVALTTDTTGNYAAGDAEAGAALTGDSATAFFSSGTVEVARGGTGIGSGTSGGVLAFTASGTLASSTSLAANALVIGGGAGAAPSTTTTGSGVLTALGITANSTGGFVTDNGTATLTGKTLDAAGTGNVLKFKSYIPFRGFDNATGALPVNTNDYTLNTYMQPVFLNGTDKASNFIEWRTTVPDDLDTSVELRARVKFKLTGGDTAAHRYVLSFASVAASAAFAGTPSTEINLDFAGDASGASGDFEQVGFTTLTSWAAGLTAGNLWVVRLARDGDTSDASTVDSAFCELTIEYGVTQ